MQEKIDQAISKLVKKENKWGAFLHYSKDKPYWNFVLYLRSHYLELQQKPLPFKHFDKLIQFIVQQEEWDNHMHELLKGYDGKDTGLTGFYSNTTGIMTELLENLMDDRPTEYGSDISWWLWDAPDRGRGKKKNRTITLADSKKKYDLKTPGDLYDYLMENPHEE